MSLREPDQISRDIAEILIPTVQEVLGSSKVDPRKLKSYLDVSMKARERILKIPGVECVPVMGDTFAALMNGCDYPQLENEQDRYLEIADKVIDEFESNDDYLSPDSLLRRVRIVAARLNYFVCATLTTPQLAESALRASYIDSALEMLDSISVRVSPVVHLRQPTDVQAKMRKLITRDSSASENIEPNDGIDIVERFSNIVVGLAQEQYEGADALFKRNLPQAEQRALQRASQAADELVDSIRQARDHWHDHLAGGGNLLDAFHAVIAKETAPRV